MKQILIDYIDICLKFRKGCLSKPERKQRHMLLTEWSKTQYAEEHPTLLELYAFWDKYQGMGYHKIFIEKVILPTVNEDFQNGGVEGLKFLFHCLQGKDEMEYSSTRNPVFIFSEAHNYTYSPVQLADRLLEKEPDHEAALKLKYFVEKEYLFYSIHEVPCGILKGVNGASISDIPNMLKLVDNFEAMSIQLKMNNDKALIADCRKLYVAYREYLNQQTQYADFEDYLNRNNISYEPYCNTYYFQ